MFLEPSGFTSRGARDLILAPIGNGLIRVENTYGTDYEYFPGRVVEYVTPDAPAQPMEVRATGGCEAAPTRDAERVQKGVEFNNRLTRASTWTPPSTGTCQR